MKPKMSREALRIYNANRRRLGQEPIRDDDTDTTDAQEAFQQTVDEVTPYTTGLQTDTDDPDYAKNIKQELDWISNSTQYLFNAVDAAQDTWDQAVQAAGDAADAQKTANDAYNQAIANAQEIVTLHDDIDNINIDIGDIDSSISGLQTQVTTNTGNITTLTGQVEKNTDGVNDYYNVWGVKTNSGGMVRGAAFVQNQSSPGDAAFIVDANFAVVNGSSTKPVLYINSSTGELSFNGTCPDAQTALTNAQNAYNAAEAAQNQAIDAMNEAALTSSFTRTTGTTGTYTVTVLDNKTEPRQISLLPVIVAGTTSGDYHSISLKVQLNGATLYDDTLEGGGPGYDGIGMTLIYAHGFTMNPGSGNQTYTVTMDGGMHNMQFGSITVLSTRNASGDFQ